MNRTLTSAFDTLLAVGWYRCNDVQLVRYPLGLLVVGYPSRAAAAAKNFDLGRTAFLRDTHSHTRVVRRRTRARLVAIQPRGMLELGISGAFLEERVSSSRVCMCVCYRARAHGTYRISEWQNIDNVTDVNTYGIV